MKPTVQHVLRLLKSKGSRRNVEGMARFGITSAKAYGVPAPAIRAIAKKVGTNHALALELWSTGVHEARAVASMIADPKQVTRPMMNTWVNDFDNWAECDCACGVLFDKTPWAYDVAEQWAGRKREFVRRAGFVMMAVLAVHDKAAPDRKFLKFLPVIKRGSVDERNFVKKAVNWALRQIGKRNSELRIAALRSAKTIRTLHSSSARWIAADAIRELERDAVRRRVRRKSRLRSIRSGRN